MYIHVLVFKSSMLEMHAILHFFFSAIECLALVSTSNDFFFVSWCAKSKAENFHVRVYLCLGKKKEGNNSILTFIVMYPWQKVTRPGPGLMKDLSLKILVLSLKLNYSSFLHFFSITEILCK